MVFPCPQIDASASGPNAATTAGMRRRSTRRSHSRPDGRGARCRKPHGQSSSIDPSRTCSRSSRTARPECSGGPASSTSRTCRATVSGLSTSRASRAPAAAASPPTTRSRRWTPGAASPSRPSPVRFAHPVSTAFRPPTAGPRLTFSLAAELGFLKRLMMGGAVQGSMDAEMKALDTLKQVLENR